MTLVYLVEITAYDDTSSPAGTRTLRYASQGWAGSGAPGLYDGRLMDPPTIRRTAFAAGTTQGAVETGYGEIRLANPDGALDDLVDYGFDGRSLRILVGDVGDAYSSFVLLMKGTIEQATFTYETVSFRIRDRLFELDEPIQTTRYRGDNASSPSTELEGSPDDVGGQVKPRVYGRVLNVTPAPVNPSLLIYQVSDNAVADVAAVYEGGLSITKGSNYASISQLLGTAPSAGQYRALPGSGYFRLGSSPTLPITADVDEGAAGSDRTAAQILKRIAEGPGGIDPADVSSADVTALDGAASAQVGIYVAGETTVRAVMSEVATSVGAWFGFDRTGVLRMRRLEAPSGTPVATFRVLGRSAVATATTGDIVAVERVPTDDQGRGLPAYRVNLRCRRNWTPQDNGQIAGAVTQDRRAFLADAWRVATSENAALQTKHPRSPELTFDSLLVTTADGATEAARRQVLYGTRRDRIRLRTLLTPALAALIDLGSVVSVEMDRYGYDAGRLMAVLGIDYGVDPLGRPDLVDLDLWG